MTQSFKYDRRIILNLMSSTLNITNVNIDSTYKVEETINNIIHYLSLEKFLQVEGTEYYNSIEFTLEAKSTIKFSDFQKNILKFQEFIDSTYQKPIQIIEEFKQILAKFPKDYEHYISRTNKDEYFELINHNSPKYWYFKKLVTYQFAETVYDYFKKLGYKSLSSIGLHIYLLANPKTIEKSKKNDW